jgi:hypothetical protein
VRLPMDGDKVPDKLWLGSPLFKNIRKKYIHLMVWSILKVNELWCIF